jgi:iron complex outermembrane receptor protein
VKRKSSIFFLLCFVIPICFSNNLYAQLSGQIIDAKSFEPLAGANVVLIASGIGAVTDEDGYFFLRPPEGFENDTLIVSFLGYQEYKILAGKFVNKSLIKLNPSVIYGDSVIVQAETFDLPKQEIPHAAEKLTFREIEEYGTIEIGDLFKTFSSVRVEGNDLDGRFVQIRGSDPDEVNVYIDGVQINCQFNSHGPWCICWGGQY